MNDPKIEREVIEGMLKDGYTNEEICEERGLSYDEYYDILGSK